MTTLPTPKKKKFTPQQIAAGAVGVVTLVILMFASNTDLFRGQLTTEAPNPELTIWKLTHVSPSEARGDEAVGNAIEKGKAASLLTCAIEATSGNHRLSTISFEVDIDDNSETLSPLEEQALSQFKEFTLSSADQGQVGRAEAVKEGSKILVSFKNLEIPLQEGSIKTFMLKAAAAEDAQPGTTLRVQFAPEHLKTQATDENAPKITADLGSNNNQIISDDLLSSDFFAVK